MMNDLGRASLSNFPWRSRQPGDPRRALCMQGQELTQRQEKSTNREKKEHLRQQKSASFLILPRMSWNSLGEWVIHGERYLLSTCSWPYLLHLTITKVAKHQCSGPSVMIWKLPHYSDVDRRMKKIKQKDKTPATQHCPVHRKAVFLFFFKIRMLRMRNPLGTLWFGRATSRRWSTMKSTKRWCHQWIRRHQELSPGKALLWNTCWMDPHR